MINTNDAINGCIQLAAGVFSCLNIRRILKDKTLKGVSWIPIIFFTCVGGWNLFFYSSLHQSLSFIGGLFIFAVNIVWLYLVYFYKHRYNKLLHCQEQITAGGTEISDIDVK